MSEAKEEKLRGYTAREWMFAFLDVLDGNSSSVDIHEKTGLPMPDCARLSKMFSDATSNGWPTD